jgi:hypothetical protein
MAVTANEFRWREWVLGEGEFAGKGPRSQPRPDVGYGGPGQKKVPQPWWRRFEEFLTRRNDHAETPGEKQGSPPKKIVRAKPGQLTVNFNVREFACHDGRQVPKIAVPALTRLCQQYLEPVRAQYGPVKILSGYRPRDYNAKIGGARFSQHIYELSPSSVAADFVCARGTPREWHRFLDGMLHDPGGLGLYSSFVHVDNRPVRARWTG